MENDVKAMEDVFLYGPGRVKQGLLWLRSEEAERLGLSLSNLIEYALLNPETAVDFDLSFCDKCALGYAGEDGFTRTYYEKGAQWLSDHGFLVGPGVPVPEVSTQSAYEALTNEWRTQLQAIVDERRPA